MRLDQNEVKPIYLQIAEGIEDDILDKMLNEGEQAYSQYQIARQFGINPATAAKGINQLVMRGILYKVRGRGMYVSKGAREMIMNERKSAFSQTFIKDLLAEASKLEITKEELIKMIRETKGGVI